jgi:hypothetical protein
MWGAGGASNSGSIFLTVQLLKHSIKPGESKAQCNSRANCAERISLKFERGARESKSDIVSSPAEYGAPRENLLGIYAHAERHIRMTRLAIIVTSRIPTATWLTFNLSFSIHMSRVPPPPRARTPSKAKALIPPASRTRADSPSKPSAPMVSPTRVRTKSTPQTPSKSLRRPLPQDEPPVPKTPVSIREAIALKRAEAKKAERASSSSRNGDAFGDLGSLEDALPTKKEEEDHVDELGRWSVKETIERARSTGDYGFCSYLCV